MRHDVIYRNNNSITAIIFGPRKPKVTKVTTIPDRMSFYNWLIATTAIKFIAASLGIVFFVIAIFVANPLLGVISLAFASTTLFRAAIHR